MSRPGEELARELFGVDMPSVKQYVDILISQGVDYGLLGPREVDRIWERHILNSAALTELLADHATVADVGSGAGLPGIPIALLRPDLRLTLIEPLLRRSNFLRLAVAELGLADRVLIVRARAEEHRGRYDVVTARAVAPLDRLVAWCNPLRLPGGRILALKGRSAADEIRSAARVLGQLRLTARLVEARSHPEAEPATVVCLEEAGSDVARGF